MTVIQLNVKMCVTIFRAPRIQRLVEDINGPLFENYINKEEDFQMIQREYKYDVKVSSFFFTASFLLFLVNLTKPLAVTMRHVYEARWVACFSGVRSKFSLLLWMKGNKTKLLTA